MNQNQGPSIDEILKQVDIESFANQHLPAPAKKQSKNWLYDCPVCGVGGKKRLSFTPGVAKDIPGPWRCNNDNNGQGGGCGLKGNLYSFLTKIMGMAAKDAVNLLKEAAGLPVEQKQSGASRQGSSKKENKKENKKEKKRDPNPLPITPPSSVAIYQRLTDLLHLTPEHREEFKAKRGFTDEIIDRLKFRSGGAYVAEIITQLSEEFKPDELLLSGVVAKNNNVLIPCQQLLDGRPLIPYLDENGGTYHLRPHKLGFEGVAPSPYCKHLIKDNPQNIVMTEGEFKAVALTLGWGIPAIGVPGIQIFTGKYFDRFVSFLRDSEIEHITIIFDSEEKGDPAIPGKFKERIEDRYEVLYYAYLNAIKLSGQGFQVVIGQLPEDWRESGKVDFDMALAQGRTKADIEKVIQTAVPAAEFLDSLSEEAQRVIRKKKARLFAKSKIYRDFNKYVAKRRPKNGDPYEEDLSNFIVNIKSLCFGSDGVTRYIQLINEFGEASDTFPLLPGDMSSSDSFRKFCFAKGNYVFEGTGDDLINLWKYEFIHNSGEIIYMPEKIGRIFDNMWLFGNVAIRDKEVYRPNNEGVFWIDGKGYKPQSLDQVPEGGTKSNVGTIPTLYEKGIDILEVIEKMKSAVGFNAYVGIGWAIASIFSDDIFSAYKCSPFLYCHGKKGSGKTTFMRWIMRIFGIETNGINLPESSQNSIMRSLSYFCSTGVWYDEYRNEKDVMKKDGYFRSAYNRQSTGKGIKSGFGIKTYSVNANIAITGEETPKDTGLFERCTIIQFSPLHRNGTWLKWLNQESYKFSYLTYYLIMNYDNFKDKILATIDDLRTELIHLGINERIAENWAIIAGSFDAVIKQDNEFIAWIAQTCKEFKEAVTDEEMLTQFWDDVTVMYSGGKIGKDEIAVKDDLMYIWFSSVYNAWAIYYKTKNLREAFDSNTIKKYMKDEPYYMKNKEGNHRVNGTVKKCVVISKEKVTGSILTLFEMAEKDAPAPSAFNDD